MNKENEENNSEYGIGEGTCIACDLIGRINDLGLCQDCFEKLERDLIRQRDFERTASGFGLSPEQQEKLREEVIKNYGQALELIEPEKPKKKKGKRRQ